MAQLKWSASFKKDYLGLPEDMKKRIQKQFRLLKQNSQHPSLQIKKTKGEVLRGYTDVFEGRINNNYRFLFVIDNDVLLFCVAAHMMTFFEKPLL